MALVVQKKRTRNPLRRIQLTRSVKGRVALTVVKENEELKKRMSGVEEMVANLIVDQQAMAKVFQERGDQHSGSLERHRANLNTARREIDRLQTNQGTIVDECSILRTQVESMGDNLCRSGLRKKLLDSSLLISS